LLSLRASELALTEHGSIYEAYYRGTSRDWFRAVLIDRTAFGRA
jgi:hypothetical protein